ncbi:hypothetical protein, partial [Staphylococcus aureus]
DDQKQDPQPPKTPMTDKGFKRALEAVTAGTYTVEQILASNTVTPDQETALRDAEKERAK